MMKNVSLGLNIVLLAAVIILYVKVFSAKSSDKNLKANSTTSVSANIPRSPIAYVELDSLNEHINYIKSRRSELENDQRTIETEWQNGYRNLENEKNNFLKKGNAITQEEAEKFRNELMQQQQVIDGKKQSETQRLSERSYKFMEDIQKKLKDFLADYNRDKSYQYIFTTGTGLDYMVYKDDALNITKEVIDGMNEKLSKEK